jgi:hypothetical protein
LFFAHVINAPDTVFQFVSLDVDDPISRIFLQETVNFIKKPVNILLLPLISV